MLSYERFLAEGELLARASHERVRRAGREEKQQVATWAWRRGPRPHLDGNAFLVSVGNVRQVQREEQRMSGGDSDEEEEEDAPLQPLDEEDVCIARAPAPLEATETVLLELHIVFHATYRTPALYFRAAAVDGTPVSSDRVLRGVHFTGRGSHTPVVASVELHPVLGTPYSLLHPCETAAAMELLLAQVADPETSSSSSSHSSLSDGSEEASPTYLASWLSLVQPLTGISPTDYSGGISSHR